MRDDIISKIISSDKMLTKAERKVATFVLQSPHEVLYLSITDLAEQCGVGDTTVFRFCKTLKLDGYQDFKMMLAQSISSNESSSNLTLSDEINIADSTDEVCRKLLNTDITALNQTFEMLNIDDINNAVTLISEARLIYFFGAGASSIMALEACNKFGRIMPNVISTQELHSQAMSSSLLGENDLVIAFSYSGSTKDIIDNVKRAKQNKAKTICITKFAESPLTAYADIVLLCGANEGPFQGGALSSRVAQLYLLDVLYTEYFKKNFVVSDFNKRRTTESISSKLL